MSFWERYARMGPARASLLLALALGLCALAYAQLGALRIDTQLGALLPDDTPTALALAKLSDRVSSDSPFTVLIVSDDPELNRQLSERVVETLKTWDEVRWVTDRRGLSPLIDAAALYLETETLEDLAADAEERVDWEYCERMPGCVNMFERDELAELPSREDLVEDLSKTPSGRALSAYAGQDLNAMWKSRRETDGGEAGTHAGDDLLCAKDGGMCAVQASLRGSASDLGFARAMLEKADAMFEALRPADAPASLRLVVSGRYRNAPMERMAIEDDLQRTTVVSCSLILLLLVLQFRGLRALVLLLVPLCLAIVGTLGLLAVVHPDLNLISAFTLAILAGVGVDFGIHLLTHYGSDRAAGLPVPQALGHTLRALFGSLLAAGATTGCAFAALSASNFRGIAQMGWMAGLGVALSLGAFLLLLPAVALVSERVRAERGTLLRRSWLQGVPAPTLGGARLVALAGVVVGVVSALLGTGVRLETDFRRLQTPAISQGLPPRSSALGGTAGLPVYLMADSAAQLAEASEDLLERDYDGIDEGKGALLLSPSVLLPQDQEPKLAALASLRRSIERMRKHADEAQTQELDELEPWVEPTQPLTPESLPVSVRESLTEKEGTFGRLGVLYLLLRGTDAVGMEKLAAQLETWRDRYEGVTFASPSAMLGEVVPALRADALTIVGLALLGLTLASAVFGRSLRRTLWVLAPVLLAMLWSAGAMALTDLRINLYNVLVLPVAFGIGVDGAVYVVWATSDAPDAAQFWARYKVAAQAVLGSSLTSMAAFGSIALAQNPGLGSLGELALWTIAFSVLANLVWLPCVLRLRATFDQRPASSA